MFRSPPYLKKVDYERVNLDAPPTLPANNQHRDVFYDWFNAYLRVEYKFETVEDGADIGDEERTAPINSSFSLIKNMIVRSAGKNIYEANDVCKVISIKNVVEYSDDYARTVAKDEFWYLDTSNSTVVDNTATNNGIVARRLLAKGNKTVKTVIRVDYGSCGFARRSMEKTKKSAITWLTARWSNLWTRSLGKRGNGGSLWLGMQSTRYRSLVWAIDSVGVKGVFSCHSIFVSHSSKSSSSQIPLGSILCTA